MNETGFSQPMPSSPTDTDPEASAQLTLLYDPLVPSRALVPHELGDSLTIDAHGNIDGVNPRHGLCAAILPVLTISRHGWYVLTRFLH